MSLFQSNDTEKHAVGKEIISLLSIDHIPLGGLNSGVPTRTTATLTPTTLRNVEQTSIELQCQVESHQNQAGFVPPVVQPSQGILMSLVDTKSWQGGLTRITEPRPDIVVTSSLEQEQLISQTPPRRNLGGRKPNKDLDVSPEEEERRAVRRERNKMAAARCRKRRLDHTNELIEETDELEERKLGLQNEIQQLQLQKEELEFILGSHKPCCHLKPPSSPPDVKPFISGDCEIIKIEPDLKKISNVTSTVIKGNALSTVKKRPDSLPVHIATSISEVPLTTPTTGIPFNFESLMEGGTGLTPVSAPLVPSCSSQQRNCDLSSPDSSKLVSL